MSTIALHPLLRHPPSLHLLLLRRRPPLLHLHPPQTRSANLLVRPKRPWLLDQIVILSDGSSYKQLTTSPRGVIRSSKDVRNHPLWNPSLKELMDVEEDEAGRLKAFRGRFGRGFDLDRSVSGGGGGGGGEDGAAGREEEREKVDNLVDLFSEVAMDGRGGGGKKKKKKEEEEGSGKK